MTEGRGVKELILEEWKNGKCRDFIKYISSGGKLPVVTGGLFKKRV